jgi:hypothetical protein
MGDDVNNGGKLFVFQLITPDPFMGKHKDIKWDANHGDNNLVRHVFLDKTYNVVALADESYQIVTRDDHTPSLRNNIPESAMLELGVYSNPEKHTLDVRDGRLKGTDGRFVDDHGWFSASSFKKFELPMDEQGFTDFKTTDAQSKIHEAFELMVRNKPELSPSRGDWESQGNGEPSKPRVGTGEGAADDPGKAYVAGNVVPDPFTGIMTDNHDVHGIAAVVLDKDLNVIGVINRAGGCMSSDNRQWHDLATAESQREIFGSAAYCLFVGNADAGTRKLNVNAGTLKGPDGNLSDDHGWFSGSSFKPFDLQIDDQGFINFKSQDARAALRASFEQMIRNKPELAPPAADAEKTTSLEHPGKMANAVALALDPTHSPRGVEPQAGHGLSAGRRKGSPLIA